MLHPLEVPHNVLVFLLRLLKVPFPQACLVDCMQKYHEVDIGR